jgi:hypothetical protein
MTNGLRKIVVLVAIAAVAVASCYAPRFAHASKSLAAALEQAGHGQVHDDHSHGIGHSAVGHEDDAKAHGGQSGSDKNCCAAACAPAAFIFAGAQLPDAPHQQVDAILLIDQLRSIIPSALDPPPRSV